MHDIILGSSSSSRQELFKKFGLKHQTASPDIDETPKPGETGLELTQRLSHEKAQKLTTTYTNSLIITGDQLIEVNQNILGKPVDHDHAVEQLRCCSGQRGSFHTSMTIYQPTDQSYHSHTVNGMVEYQTLSDEVILQYLELDQPWHAAGSIRLEAHGFTLLKTLESEDPYAILGMNMLWLSCSLRDLGYRFHDH